MYETQENYDGGGGDVAGAVDAKRVLTNGDDGDDDLEDCLRKKGNAHELGCDNNPDYLSCCCGTGIEFTVNNLNSTPFQKYIIVLLV